MSEDHARLRAAFQKAVRIWIENSKGTFCTAEDAFCNGLSAFTDPIGQYHSLSTEEWENLLRTVLGRHRSSHPSSTSLKDEVHIAVTKVGREIADKSGDSFTFFLAAKSNTGIIEDVKGSRTSGLFYKANIEIDDEDLSRSVTDRNVVAGMKRKRHSSDSADDKEDTGHVPACPELPFMDGSTPVYRNDIPVEYLCNLRRTLDACKDTPDQPMLRRFAAWGLTVINAPYDQEVKNVGENWNTVAVPELGKAYF
ncbi:hypothetical protein HDU96_001859, partial [Phlyctochytrium bullatum]